MRKIALALATLTLLGACSSQASKETAPVQASSDEEKEAEFDTAAEQADPVGSNGKTLNVEAVKVVFAAACSDAKPIEIASCKAGEKPGEFACDYAFKGENVFNMKHAVIAEDGDGWKLIDAPTHCTAQ